MSDDAEADGSDGDTGDGRGDPFDSFEEYRDREGDPFDSFGDGPADGDASTGSGDSDPARGADEAGGASDEAATPGSADEADADPFEYMGDPGGAGSDRTRGESERGDSADVADGADEPDRFGGRGEDPLADVAVSEEDPFESRASAFERSDVDGIDPDEVWERFTEGATAEDEDREGADPVEREDDIATVSKHSYCEGCEYFSAPPDVTCGHEGTDILEFVDVDSVRVSNCPVVDERRELEEDA